MKLTTIIEGIKHQRDRIKDEAAWENTAKLSEIGIKLSTYNGYLSDELGELKADRENKKAKSYMVQLSLGKSATAADSLSRIEVAEITGNIDKIDLLYKSTSGIVGMIQSKIKAMNTERLSL